MENTDLQNQDKKIKADLFDIIMSIFCFASVYLIISFIQTSVNFNGIGFSVVYTVFFAVGSAYISLKQRHFPKTAIFPGIVCLLVAVGIALHESVSAFVGIVFILCLSVYYCAELSGANAYPKSSYLYIIELFRMMTLQPMGNLFTPYASMVRCVKSKKGNTKLLGVIAGAVCAVPVFAIAFSLLQSGDAAFEAVTFNITKRIEKLLFEIDSTESIYVAVQSVLFAVFVYAEVFTFKYKTALNKQGRLREKAEKSRFVSPNIIGGFLGSISLLYAVYLLSQTTYLFSAFGGNIPGSVEISLAQYARRGFFEMSTIAVINLCLIGVGVLFCKRENNKISSVVKYLGVFLCAFTMLLIVTAMSKIALYISEYGLTHKRLAVAIIDVILFLCFACVTARLFSEKLPYMKIIISVCCVFAVSVTLVNVDYVIGKFNVKAYLSGQHDTIDLDEIYYLDEYTAMMCFDELVKYGKNTPESDTCKMYMGRIYENNKEYFGIYTLDRILLQNYMKEHESTLKEYYKKYGWEYSPDIGRYTDEYTEELYFFIESEKEITSVSLTNEQGETVGIGSAEWENLERYEPFFFEVKYIPGDGIGALNVTVNTADEKEYSFTVMEDTYYDKNEDPSDVVIRHSGNIFSISDKGDDSISLTSKGNDYAFDLSEAQAFVQKYKYGG